MPQDNPFADAWRSALQHWETETNKMLNQATGSEESAKAMNATLSGALRMQTAFKEAMEKGLDALNLPSRSDILQLSEQVAELSRKVDALGESMKSETTSRPLDRAGAPKPARTRQPATDTKPSS